MTSKWTWRHRCPLNGHRSTADWYWPVAVFTLRRRRHRRRLDRGPSRHTARPAVDRCPSAAAWPPPTVSITASAAQRRDAVVDRKQFQHRSRTITSCSCVSWRQNRMSNVELRILSAQVSCDTATACRQRDRHKTSRVNCYSCTAYYVTQNSSHSNYSSLLFSATFIWTGQFNLLHTATIVHHISLFHSELKTYLFRKPCPVPPVCFCLSDWSHSF